MTTGWNAALLEIGTIPSKPAFARASCPTRAGAALTKAISYTAYKSKTRSAEVTPTRQPPIVSIALVAS
jgi:hypothetical protein